MGKIGLLIGGVRGAVQSLTGVVAVAAVGVSWGAVEAPGGRRGALWWP